MSSNIGPEAQAAYQKYLDATTIDERIKRLEEFISLVPKHKATEKIVALNKSRLAKLRKEQEALKARAKTTGKLVSPFSIKKEGIKSLPFPLYFLAVLFHQAHVGWGVTTNGIPFAFANRLPTLPAKDDVNIISSGFSFSIIDSRTAFDTSLSIFLILILSPVTSAGLWKKL